jgi:hypothetical protein
LNVPKFRSDNIYLHILGESKTLAEWAEESGVSRQTIQRRLALGWSHFDAVFKEPRDNSAPRIQLDGEEAGQEEECPRAGDDAPRT